MVLQLNKFFINLEYFFIQELIFFDKYLRTTMIFTIKKL